MKMPRVKKTEKLFYKYFEEWVKIYKEGAVQPITLNKYHVSTKWIKQLAPDLKLGKLDRRSYQLLLNEYAKTHERQTVNDFHRHLKGAILDAIEDGLLLTNPARKVVLKGKEPRDKKQKFLSEKEVKALIAHLSLDAEISWDWLFYLLLKTGMRFSEALALTPADFDFHNKTVNITKTWNYKKTSGGFLPTKNSSSVRKIAIDRATNQHFRKLTRRIANEQPIFAQHKISNATINIRLRKLCEKAGVPVISLHGCRHTHASLLIYAGVSIASVAKRLGHSSIATTQQTYLHIIKELENQDNEKIVKHLSSL